MSKAHLNFASISKSLHTWLLIFRAPLSQLFRELLLQLLQCLLCSDSLDFHLQFSRTSSKYFSLKYLRIQMVPRINKQGNGVLYWSWNQAILICCLIPPTINKRDPAHWTSEVTLVMSTRFLVEVNSNDTHASRAQDLCLLWLFVVSLLWPKMREECGEGLCSSLAGQSHKAGPKARDDLAGRVFFFTSWTMLRTVKPWPEPEQSLLKQNLLQWCVLDTNGGRQRRHLCLMKYISRQ